jgi:hypothetical protein
MEEKVAKSLEAVLKEIKDLILSANNEAEMIGLVTLFAVGFQDAYDKAVDEAVDELAKKLKEEN